MNTHLRIVAGEFRVFGLLFGVPSLATFGLAIYSAIDLGSVPVPPPDKSDYLDVGTYGLTGLLVNGGEAIGTGLGKLLELLSSAAPWIIGALAMESLAMTLFAVLLYFTGQGIGRSATWARIVGILLTTGSMIVFIGMLVILPQGLMLLACLPMALSLYTLWVLCRRYA